VIHIGFAKQAYIVISDAGRQENAVERGARRYSRKQRVFGSGTIAATTAAGAGIGALVSRKARATGAAAGAAAGLIAGTFPAAKHFDRANLADYATPGPGLPGFRRKVRASHILRQRVKQPGLVRLTEERAKEHARHAGRGIADQVPKIRSKR